MEMLPEALKVRTKFPIQLIIWRSLFSAQGKPLDSVKNEIHEVICDLPKEVIEAVLNESNPSLNQESRLNLIKSDCSTEGVKSNNEETEGGEKEGTEEGDQETKLEEKEEERIVDGSKEKKVMKPSFERVLSLSSPLP